MSWSDKWKLGFNPEKCNVMHFGHSLDTEYSMRVQGKVWELEETTEERDLEIIVTSGLVSQNARHSAGRSLLWLA